MNSTNKGWLLMHRGGQSCIDFYEELSRDTVPLGERARDLVSR